MGKAAHIFSIICHVQLGVVDVGRGCVDHQQGAIQGKL
jgi:hypothetical protein